jgi:hypothetical protein
LCSLWTDRQQILLHLKEETKDAIVQSRKIWPSVQNAISRGCEMIPCRSNATPWFKT